MIDERAHGGMMMMRSGNGYGGRFGDSMPDYDNVKVHVSIAKQFNINHTFVKRKIECNIYFVLWHSFILAIY